MSAYLSSACRAFRTGDRPIFFQMTWLNIEPAEGVRFQICGDASTFAAVIRMFYFSCELLPAISSCSG
jgi:hypothetical protein